MEHIQTYYNLKYPIVEAIFALCYAWTLSSFFNLSPIGENLKMTINFYALFAFLAVLTRLFTVKRQFITLVKNKEIRITNVFYFGRKKEKRIPFSNFQNCFIYEYLSVIRVMYKLGINLKDKSIFSDFSVG